jgi:serine phosphatase RsbU (regulator of sigma subunit)
MRSAGGSSFAGDFIVASTAPDGRSLEVAVVDVSGKGEQAGARSGLLSGSFGGLLGALPPRQVLSAAYVGLVRGEWGVGVAGSRGESMLVDLRERIARQSQMPSLPREWYAEAVMRSAGGSSFAGDFIVASTAPDGRSLEVAVVDVSGKGEQAGTRSLLLSGSFGGLLGALPPHQFLSAANDYLLRQDWSEGFATAVHLSLELDTGKFELRSAGHPPAVQLLAGSGRWAIHDVEGPVLGLMTEARFEVVSGTLNHGDALLMYTDGLVETPERDVSLGIDRLLGQGERMLRQGFENGARRLIDELESMSDDRALFMLHRR